MKRFRYVLIGLLPLLSACVALSAPKPVDQKASVVAISISLKAPLVSFLRQTPQVAYFVRLDKDGNPASGYTPIASNKGSGGDLFLFNAKPGRYAVVGAMYSKSNQPGTSKTTVSSTSSGSSTFTLSFTPRNAFGTFFTEELIKLTTVTVKPGEFNYIGDFVISMHNGMDEADGTQRRYAALVDAKGRMNHYRGNKDSVDKSKKTKIEFLKEMKKKLEKSGWEAHIQRAINSLQ